MLPLRKVVLYKHGVGYFERQGPVSGDAAVELNFKASEMNDVLKSLTTLDLSGGLISSISYESTKPVEKQLEDIALHLEDQNTLTALCTQIKGAEVELTVGEKRIRGTVTGLETVQRAEKETVIATTRIALLLGGETLQTWDLAEVKALRLVDEGVRKDLQHLLDVLIGAKKKDLKRLTIYAKGSGKRDVLASYLVETPVWKTSYRTLLQADKKPKVQGWALVDNTQDEDWENVRLTLVAGLPISFVHDLYSPRYKRRPIVQVHEEEAYAPPELESAAGAYDADELDAAGGREEYAKKDMARARRSAPAATMPAPSPKALAEARQQSVQVQTRTVEVGDLFQYEIRNPVTVKRNQSALVPILHEPFDGKRVAIYNQEIRDKNPMSAILFKNTTGMTLEGGPMTVLEDETYVGESMLDTMKPDEERIVPFSVELGCVITIDHKSDLRDVHFSSISDGVLYLNRYRIQRRIYVIDNKTDKKLDLFLEHRFNHGWDLVETDKPVEKTENFHRFRLDIPAKKAVKFVVSERGDATETYSLDELSRDQVRMFISSKYLDAKTAEAVKAVLDQMEKVARIEERIQRLDEERSKIHENQERLRSNLNSLGGSEGEKELRNRYIKQMNKEEDRIQALDQEYEKLAEEKDALEKSLRKQIKAVKFEQKMA